jgi:hypothetical protein
LVVARPGVLGAAALPTQHTPKLGLLESAEEVEACSPPRVCRASWRRPSAEREIDATPLDEPNSASGRWKSTAIQGDG